MAISVDRDFARFGKKAYAINKINTVDVRSSRPHGQSGIVLWTFGALICLFFGPVGWLLALCCLGLAYYAWKLSKIIEYGLFLRTSSSEAQALTSRDEEYILSLREHIEAAMAGRMA